jgi:hypothetical protein
VRSWGRGTAKVRAAVGCKKASIFAQGRRADSARDGERGTRVGWGRQEGEGEPTLSVPMSETEGGVKRCAPPPPPAFTRVMEEGEARG